MMIMAGLDKLREHAFQTFSNMGIPGSKHEEWKYTRVAGLFNKEFQLPADPLTGIHYGGRPEQACGYRVMNRPTNWYL